MFPGIDYAVYAYDPRSKTDAALRREIMGKLAELPESLVRAWIAACRRFPEYSAYNLLWAYAYNPNLTDYLVLTTPEWRRANPVHEIPQTCSPFLFRECMRAGLGLAEIAKYCACIPASAHQLEIIMTARAIRKQFPDFDITELMGMKFKPPPLDYTQIDERHIYEVMHVLSKSDCNRCMQNQVCSRYQCDALPQNRRWVWFRSLLIAPATPTASPFTARRGFIYAQTATAGS